MIADIITSADNNIDLTLVFNQVKTLLPVVMPAVIGFIAFRKGMSFLKGQLRSA